MFASAPATEAPGIPNGLATMPPGPVLASFLSAIDVRLLTGHDRVLVLRAHHRMAAHYQAQAYDDMAALAEHFEGQGDDPELAHDSTAAEVRAGLCWTRRAADNAVALARDLSDRIPAVAKALEGGDIDLPRVRVLASGTSHLNDDTARAVVDAVIAGAHRMTTGQLAARLRKLCAEAQPAEASNRYTRALQQRRIVGVPSPDGTCHLLGMDLPPDRVTAVMRRIDEIALSLRGDGETRSMDQLRAEVFLDLLSGTRTGGKGAVVDIRVGLSTLAELDDHSGDLAGFGPVIADIARQVVATQNGASASTTRRPDGP